MESQTAGTKTCKADKYRINISCMGRGPVPKGGISLALASTHTTPTSAEQAGKGKLAEEDHEDLVSA